ncbi:MAG: nitrate- and nitrite sensing domain-containing protein [Acidimicrobiales bacterium]
MRRFNDTTIRTKLLAIMLVPMLGLGWFAASASLSRRAEAAEAGDLDTLVQLSVRIGNLLHETQKERGATAVFMSSGGEKFRSELAAQRDTTDGARQELADYLADEGAGLPADVKAALEPALADVARLDATRDSVDSLSTPTREVIGYFTDMNARFLASIASVGTASSNDELQAMSIAYVSFLNAKENAGIERAQLANVFGEDQFAPGQYATVVSLIAKQTAFLTTFRQTADATTLAFFAEKQADPLVAQVAELEAIAIDNGVAGFDVDSGEWFDTITARINLLKEVEDQQARAILDRAGAIRSAATGSFRTSVLIAVVIIAAAAAVSSLYATYQVVRPLRPIAEALVKVSEGDLNPRVEVSSSDEIGQIGEALNHTLDRLGDSIQATKGATAAVAHNSANAAEGADRISSSIAVVASASEEMGAAINEITRSTSEAAAIA